MDALYWISCPLALKGSDYWAGFLTEAIGRYSQGTQIPPVIKIIYFTYTKIIDGPRDADCPVSCCCRIHRLLRCRGVRPSTTSVLDMTLNNCEAPVMLELLGMRCTPSLPSLPGPLWPGVEAPDRVLSMSQIKRNGISWDGTVLTFKLSTYTKLNCLK